MKIESVKATLLKVPYPLPFEAAWEPGVIRNDRDVTVVRIQADTGLVGWGASGFDQADDINMLAAPHLVGEDPFAFERHARITRYAKGAWIVEMALCDLVGKAAGLPLAKLWDTTPTGSRLTPRSWPPNPRPSGPTTPWSCWNAVTGR